MQHRQSFIGTLQLSSILLLLQLVWTGLVYVVAYHVSVVSKCALVYEEAKDNLRNLGLSHFLRCH
jgi:hypothetical protein